MEWQTQVHRVINKGSIIKGYIYIVKLLMYSMMVYTLLKIPLMCSVMVLLFTLRSPPLTSMLLRRFTFTPLLVPWFGLGGLQESKNYDLKKYSTIKE